MPDRTLPLGRSGQRFSQSAIAPGVTRKGTWGAGSKGALRLSGARVRVTVRIRFG